MKKYAFLLVLVLSIVLGISSAFGAPVLTGSCTIRELPCNGGETAIAYAYDVTNSHISVDPTVPKPGYAVCCPGTGLDTNYTSCAATNAYSFAYQLSNSHVSSSPTGINLCLGPGGLTVGCSLNDTVTDCGSRKCIFETYGSSNSHIATCGSHLGSKNLCCSTGTVNQCGDGITQVGERCDSDFTPECDSPGTCTCLADTTPNCAAFPYEDKCGCCNEEDGPQDYVCENVPGLGLTCYCIPSFVCGNGIPEGTEECESLDGGATWGEGCSSCQCLTGYDPLDPPGINCTISIDGPVCVNDSSCAQPLNTCQENKCIDGHCTMQFKANGIACSDGNLCTESDKCDGLGVCVSGSMADCTRYNIPEQSACDLAITMNTPEYPWAVYGHAPVNDSIHSTLDSNNPYISSCNPADGKCYRANTCPTCLIPNQLPGLSFTHYCSKVPCGASCIPSGQPGGPSGCIAPEICNSVNCSCANTTQCIDNGIQPPEICDGSNLSGLKCEDITAPSGGNYVGGTLGCLADCSYYDTSLCECVSIPNMELSPGPYTENSPIEVKCNSSHYGVNSITAQIEHVLSGDVIPCTFDDWQDDLAVFTCYPNQTGNFNAVCTVDTHKTCMSGVSKLLPFIVSSTPCSSFPTEGSCKTNSSCEWCPAPKCSGASGYFYQQNFGTCVVLGGCPEKECSVPECGAKCDKDVFGGGVTKCEDFGFDCGTLGCDIDSCYYDFSSCGCDVAGVCDNSKCCGNGILNTGEECDDGNLNDYDSCTTKCKLPVCGDMIKNTTEECEYISEGVPGAYCNIKCQCNEAVGYYGEPDPMNVNCTTLCGDDIEAGTEECETGGDNCTMCQCDPGYVKNDFNDGCHNPSCGNGSVEAGEECESDIYGENWGYGCTTNFTCKCDTGFIPAPFPSFDCTTSCGDGIEAGEEECEVGGDHCTSCVCDYGYSDDNNSKHCISCTLKSAKLSFDATNPSRNMNITDTTVDAGDIVDIQGKVEGNCMGVKNFSILVNAPGCPISSLTDDDDDFFISYSGGEGNIEGVTWTANETYVPSCNGIVVTASDAVLNFSVGYYGDIDDSNSTAVGSFRFGDDPLNVSCDYKDNWRVFAACDATIYGTVIDTSSSQPLEGATVRLLNPEFYSITQTDENGNYVLSDVKADGTDLIYTYMASEFYHAPYVLYNQAFDYGKHYEINASLAYGSSDCESDCTRMGDDICDADCDGRKGCLFNPITRQFCDGKITGYTYIWPSDPTLEVLCCKEAPKTIGEKKKVKVSVNADNVITTTKIVIVNGKPVKLNIITYN